MGLKFYDDTVREGLAELADVEFQKRLWLGLEPGLISSPIECWMAIFEDSGLAAALEAGDAYGEPVDGILRDLYVITVDLDLDRSIDQLESDERFTGSRRLAAEALAGLKDRALGTTRGGPLDPL